MRIQVKVNKEQLDPAKKTFDSFENRQKVPGIFENSLFRIHFYQKHISGDDDRFFHHLEMHANFLTSKLKENLECPEHNSDRSSRDLIEEIKAASPDEMIEFYESELRAVSQQNQEAIESFKPKLAEFWESNEELKEENYSIFEEAHQMGAVEIEYMRNLNEKKNKKSILSDEDVQRNYAEKWESIINTKDLSINPTYVQKAVCQICNKDPGISERDEFVFCSVRHLLVLIL